MQIRDVVTLGQHSLVLKVVLWLLTWIWWRKKRKTSQWFVALWPKNVELRHLTAHHLFAIHISFTVEMKNITFNVWLESPQWSWRVSVSHSQHECASWAEQIMGGDERNRGLTWVSPRGRSSAACYHGWLLWCKHHGSQRSRTPLCSAAPGPDGRHTAPFKRVHVASKTSFSGQSKDFFLSHFRWKPHL